MAHPKRARTLPEVDDALAGLARAVERHSTMITTGRGQTASLAVTVDQLSRSVAAATQAWSAQQAQASEPTHDQPTEPDQASAAPDRVEATEEEPTLPSWLVTTDWEAAEALTMELHQWAREVFLRWPDAVLPPCWSLHPWVIEELWVLRCCWVSARTGDTASWLRWQDWHDRQRPATARRIAEALLDCPPEAHTTPEDGPYPVVPGADVVPLAVTAWATDDHQAWPPRIGAQLLDEPRPQGTRRASAARPTNGHPNPIPRRTLS